MVKLLGVQFHLCQLKLCFFQIGSHSIFIKYLIGQELFSPLLIIMRRKPIAQNPNRVFIKELFKNPKNHSGKIKLIAKKNLLSRTFIYLDKLAIFIFSLHQELQG